MYFAQLSFCIFEWCEKTTFQKQQIPKRAHFKTSTFQGQIEGFMFTVRKQIQCGRWFTV